MPGTSSSGNSAMDLSAGSSGADALLAQLQKHKPSLDLEALGTLLAGIDAAPGNEQPDAWMDIIAPASDAPLRAALRAFRQDWQARHAHKAALPLPVAERLARLRAVLTQRGLDGFLVPRADEHQGEYVPASAERLAWISGFTGSAGFAIVLKDKAAIFVDGRYTIQVKEQVDPALFEIRHLIDQPPEAWIAANLPEGGKLGFDPRLFTQDGAARFREAAQRAKGVLTAAEDNPLDAVWAGRPAAPIAPVWPQDLRHAGRASADKRQDLAARLAADGFTAAVLSAPDSICWLLNIRGGDVPRTPFALSFALLHKTGHVDLFIDPRKLTDAARAHLGNAVSVHTPDAFGDALDKLGAIGGKVLADQATASVWICERLQKAGAALTVGEDPCALPKACKNATEIEGARAAHRRDGVAVVRFLAWFAAEAPKGALTEIAAADQLARFRRQSDLLRDFSFETIAGAGPNGAICHYRVTPESNRRIAPDSLFLIDSGGQYPDGTTDITRTLAVGTPSAEMRDRFTRVLKGHIALATIRFPKGTTTGSHLDVLARRPLWDIGLDYDHGTGHGVGSYLSVHEGPQRIAKALNRVPLAVGMILSNEPGYYKEGAFGIRIENLVAVVPDPEYPGMLGFETLTLAPIDRTLIDPALLSDTERNWINAYHARVRESLTPLLDAADGQWLAAATQPL